MYTLSIRPVFLVLGAMGVSLVAGCATPPPPVPQPPLSVADRPAAAPVDVGIEWSWRIVGDAAARPVQVFSLDGKTYLQMRDRRPVVLLVGGDVIPFLSSWPYLVIQGEPAHVDIVLEGYRAIAERAFEPAPISSQASSASRSLDAGPGARVERVSFAGTEDSKATEKAQRRIERVKAE